CFTAVSVFSRLQKDPCFVAQTLWIERSQSTRIEWRQINTLRNTVNDQLCDDLAGCWRVKDAPHTMAGGHVGILKACNPSDQRQTIRGNGTIAGLTGHDFGVSECRQEPTAHCMQVLDCARIWYHILRIDRQRAVAGDRAHVRSSVLARDHFRGLRAT